MRLFGITPWKRKKEPEAEPEPEMSEDAEDIYEKAREEARMRVIHESMERALGRRSSNLPVQNYEYCPHEW